MLGTGRGTWERWHKKRTVEDACELTIRDIRQSISTLTAGVVTWTCYPSGEVATVGYFVSMHWGATTITLQYRADEEEVCIPILLQTTATQFGGARWWFKCPLIIGGNPCSRRVGKLYLPFDGRYFGCRHCHDLTYQSRQDSRRRQPSGTQAA